MSEQKHTPGPWVSQPSKYRDGVHVVRADTAGGRILSEFGSDDEPLDPIDIANARIIAAAPDLLEALERFVEEYVEMINSGDCGFGDPEKEDKVIKARSAISKAITP